MLEKEINMPYIKGYNVVPLNITHLITSLADYGFHNFLLFLF